MTQDTYTLGAAPTIVIDACDGDLEIMGGLDDTGTATVAAGARHNVAQRGDQLVVDRCDDLRLTVPRGATIVVQRIAGDARIERVTAARIGEIAGDLTARLIEGSCEVGPVGGDVQGTDIANLALGPVGGDIRLDGLTGAPRLVRVDGDAIVRGVVDGVGPARVGGDLTLDIQIVPGHAYRFDVGGDARIALPDGADLTLRATVRGDVSGVDTSGRGAVAATWGAGSAQIILDVGGDLVVRGSTAQNVEEQRRVSPSAPDMETPASAAPPPSSQGGEPDGALAVLEAVARGDISAADADDLLARIARR